jgi:hypothetical protein
MSVDDPIEIHLEHALQDAETDISRNLAYATVAGTLSLMPGIGSAIQSLIDGKAKANMERRWIELFRELRVQIEAIRTSIPEDSFYGSEEFQTLLALAQEQLWTTHDKEKIRLLARALANSGTAEFRSDDKELMLRVLRSVSPSDLKTLDHENLKNWAPLTKRIEYGPDVLGSLSRLASSGLVIEKFLRPDPNVSDEQKLASVLKFGTWRTFQLSPFGAKFLLFIATHDHQISSEHTSPPKSQMP